MVYLGEQEDEEGKDEGKGLNRPTSNGLVLQSANLQGKGRRAHALPNGQGRGRVITSPTGPRPKKSNVIKVEKSKTIS